MDVGFSPVITVSFIGVVTPKLTKAPRNFPPVLCFSFLRDQVSGLYIRAVKAYFMVIIANARLLTV